MSAHYPGLKIGITEYSWGAENHISGATAQADVLGIFGREGLDLATRWACRPRRPRPSRPSRCTATTTANRSTFGDVSVSAASGPIPTTPPSSPPQRSADGALTLMVVNKVLSGTRHRQRQPGRLRVSGDAQVYRLASSNQITRLPDVALAGSTFPVSVPAQSITLYVLPSASGPSLRVGD